MAASYEASTVATVVATAPQSGARPLRGHSMHVVVAASIEAAVTNGEATVEATGDVASTLLFEASPFGCNLLHIPRYKAG